MPTKTKNLTKKQKIMLIVSALIIVASYSFIARQVLGVTIAGTLNMGGNRIINLQDPDPLQNSHAVNVNYLKTYVNGRIGGGAGFTNYIPKWNAAGNFIQSLISDNGTKLDFHKAETENFVIDNVINDATLAPVSGQIWMCADADGQCDG